MSYKSKFIIFDYDGTIVNSEMAIITGIKYALELYKYEIPSDEVLKKNIGRALLPVFAELTGDPNPSIHNKLLETYRRWYFNAAEKEIIDDYLYPEAFKTIKALYDDGHILGIATNKSKTGLLEGLKRHNLSSFFTTIKTIQDCDPKPLPDMGLESIREAGVLKSNTVMIGDTINDALMSKSCNIKFLGVSWGFNDTETLLSNGALSVVSSYSELYQELKNIFNS